MDSSDLKDRLERVFAKQRERRWELAKTTAAERIAKLRKLEKAILQREPELNQALREDFGKPELETELTEVLPALTELRHTVKHLRRWMKPKAVKGSLLLAGAKSELRYEPKGNVLILAPWNYPFGLVVNPLIAAVSAGNAVMVKPSEKTPRTARLLATLCAEIFDESEVAVFEGDAKVAEALLELPFDHIFFTGSTKIGKLVMSAAAKHLASVTLELGGKSPTIVDASANVDVSAERIAWGKFINAGQTCIAPDYLFVHESIAERFTAALENVLKRSYGETDEARTKSPNLARLVDVHAWRRLNTLVERSVKQGARKVIGGVGDADTHALAPTVLSGVTPEMAVMEEELFGPVLPILTFKSRDEVYRHVRANGKPLALYIFANDQKAVEEILANTTAGGTCVNNVVVHIANPNLPFGGVGESGIGSYHGEVGFRTFSHERAVMKQGGPNLGKMFYPPYTEAQRKRLRLVKKL